jgi:hypothetical protein
MRSWSKPEPLWFVTSCLSRRCHLRSATLFSSVVFALFLHTFRSTILRGGSLSPFPAGQYRSVQDDVMA